MQCEIRGTRKEASPLYRLRPRSPKFRKKGSGNNKTRETSCAPFHARKKTDLRKKGVNDGPAKGDTFRFRSTRESLSFSLFPDRFTILLFLPGESSGSGVMCRVPWHASACNWHASRRCALLSRRKSLRIDDRAIKKKLWKGKHFRERIGLSRVASALKSHDLRRLTFNLSSLRIILFIAPFA